jgi:hypothetical protein
MPSLLTLNDYTNILDYHNIKRPDSIHKIKKLAVKLINKNMCVCHINNKKIGKFKSILVNAKSKSKNKKNFNSKTVKNTFCIYVNDRNSTRNISPISLLI